jgi:DNA polymerase/3'-5' exonuclease PolX
VPLAYDASPLFASGLALVVNQWGSVRGQLPCRYTKRILPGGLCLDLFMVDPRGFGLQLAIRTGSAAWSHKVLATSWVRAGFTSKEGLLRRRDGSVINTPDERRLFELVGIDWDRYGDPVNREV